MFSRALGIISSPDFHVNPTPVSGWHQEKLVERYKDMHLRLPPLNAQAQKVVETFEALQREYDWEQAREWAKDKINRYEKYIADQTTKNMAHAWKKKDAYDEHAAFVIPRVPPDELTARVLTAQEQQDLHKTCSEILDSSPLARNARKVIEEFVEFCRLLSLPENHLMRQSGVYVEKQVIPRPVRDMEAEKAQELMRLGVGEAYLNGKQGGLQIVRKFRTERVEDRFSILKRPAETEQLVFENALALGYLRRRNEVEREIGERQKEWHISSIAKPQPRRTRPRSPRKPPPTWC